MVKVITYGSFDLLHFGHIRLLERAKALGDHLIVGVTSDDYELSRGKINVRQSLMERVAAVSALGLADEVIVEEHEGQKIDDIRKYGVDIFAIGSDWSGKFEYLEEYCQVVYLPRTDGVSSSEIRASRHKIRIGLIGEKDCDLTSIAKFLRETPYVNGVEIVGADIPIKGISLLEKDTLMESVDAVYVTSHPSQHYSDTKSALLRGKHVLCESPVALSVEQYRELRDLAAQNKCTLMEGIKTAYMTGFERLISLAKTGIIGEVISVDAICTSRKPLQKYSPEEMKRNWNTITEWGPVALLPVFQLLGTQYVKKHIVTQWADENARFDRFTKIDFLYPNAVASIKVAKGIKSEGELVISGTEGYLYVPAPWWKTDYFEARFENPADNKRYFYQLDGEGIRYEILSFVKSIENKTEIVGVSEEISEAIAAVMESYFKSEHTDVIA